MTVNLQRVGFLAAIPDLVREVGASLEDILNDAGLAAGALDDTEAMIPYASMGRLMEACVARTGVEHFGLLLGQRAGARSLGLIGELMANAPNLGTAMRDLVQHQHRHARGSVTYLVEQSDFVLFGYAIYQPDMAGVATINDGAAAVAFELLNSTSERLAREELTVHISRPEPATVVAYRRYFGCPIEFESDFTGIAMPKAWLGQTLRNANAQRRSLLEARVETYFETGSYDVVDQLRRWLTTGLLTGELSRDRFAEHVAMSRRTLNRRLQAAGHSYQSIMDDCRFELSKQLLGNTHLSVGQISVILRYAEHSEFTRACAKWSGMAPVNWKRVTTTGGGAHKAPAASQPGAALRQLDDG